MTPAQVLIWAAQQPWLPNETQGGKLYRLAREIEEGKREVFGSCTTQDPQQRDTTTGQVP